MFKRENLRKNFLRVKQNIDQNLGRAERSEVLSEDQQETEKRVDVVKHAFQNISKKASVTLQAPGSDFDKRLKKLPETGLANALIESSQTLGPDTLLGSSCLLCGECQINLAKERLQYETTVEQEFIGPLQNIVEVDIPCIVKHRKALNKSTLDMDSAKNRFHQAVRQSSVPGANIANAAAKAEVIREELEEASNKVESIKDNLSIELCNFAAKESDHTQKLLMFLEAEANYHMKALEAIQVCLPQLRIAIQNSPAKPCYGMPLEEHLRLLCRDIAVVLEVCILTLLEIGMEEEGLFRIAGSASKVKKLKACFDAQAVDIEEFESDPHTVAGSLKQYLRELPEPLLTYALHDEFMQAANTPPDYRLQALWTVINKLPTPNYNNFRYLVKFLSKLKEKSDVNKMKASNIAIVIGPNLLWSRGSDSPSMLTTGTLSSIIEAVVLHCDYFFPEVINFNLTAEGTSPKRCKEPPKALQKEKVEQQSNLQKTPNKELHQQPRGGNKENKSPVPPKACPETIKSKLETCEDQDDSSSDENNPFSEKYVEKPWNGKTIQDNLSEKKKAASVIDTGTGDYDNILYTTAPQSSLYRSNTVTSLYPVKGSMGNQSLHGMAEQHNFQIKQSSQFRDLTSSPSFQGYSGKKQCPPFPLLYDSYCESDSSAGRSGLSEPHHRHLAGSTPNISIFSKAKPEEKNYSETQSSYWSRPSQKSDSLNYHSLKRGSAPAIVSPPPAFLSPMETSGHSHRRSGSTKISRSQLGQPPPPRHATGPADNDASKPMSSMTRPLDKSFHEDTYGTAFALTSLGASDTSSDYLTKVRAMWDDHHAGGPSISRESSPGSNLSSATKSQSPGRKLASVMENQTQDQESAKQKDLGPRPVAYKMRPGGVNAVYCKKKEQEIDFTNVGYRYDEDHDKSPVPSQSSNPTVDGPTLQVRTVNQHPVNSRLSSPVSNNSSSNSLLVPSDSPEVSSPVQRRTSRKPAPPPPPERPFTVMVTAATTPVTKPDGDSGNGNSSQTWPRSAPLASPETDVPAGAERQEKHRTSHTERPSMPPPERPKPPPPVTIAPGRGHQRSASTGAMMMSNAGGGGGDGAPGIPNAGTVSSYNIASSGEGSTSVESTQNTLSLLPPGSSHTIGRSVSLRPRHNPPPPPPVARESEDTKL